MIASVLLVLLLQPIQDRPADPSADLAAARTLYGTAAYDEALVRLARISATGPLQDQVDTYRALCQLALGRTREAEQTVELVLQRNPQFVPDEADVSPRFILIFRSVRARLLPAAARDLYAAARISYDKQDFPAAAAQLRQLLVLVGDASDGGLADLKVLAEGFLKLAESARSTAPTNSSASPPTSPVPNAAAPIYSILDREVSAPVEIARWVPTMVVAPKGTQPGFYQGLIEVVIDENGRVESAVVRRSIAAAFDADLLAATAKWRFQPATLDNKPVKYRRSYEIIGYSWRVPDDASSIVPR